MITCSMPAATASSTAYWMTGLSTSGSISFGCAFVAGRNRVPHPAARNACQEAARPDPEDEVERAVDDQDRAAIGKEAIPERAASDPAHRLAAAPGEVAAGRDGSAEDGTVATPEPGECHGPHR